MKKFLAVYLGTASALEKSGWNKMDEGKRKEIEASGMKAWRIGEPPTQPPLLIKVLRLAKQSAHLAKG